MYVCVCVSARELAEEKKSTPVAESPAGYPHHRHYHHHHHHHCHLLFNYLFLIELIFNYF